VKWILAGKNDAAIGALEYAAAAGDEVLVLAVHGDRGEDGWQRSLARAARRLGVRCEQPARINAPETAERLRGFGAHALISIQYDQILRAPLLERLGCPSLNLHFSLLPRHRGVSTIAWAILSGDAETGVTLHHITPAIDAGDLIRQKRVAIGPGDSARALYDRVSQAAVELFRECHPFPEALLEKRLPQDADAACYHRHGDFDFSRRAIDWRRGAQELQRWLRALIFPPFQFPETRAGARRLAVTRVGGEIGPAGGAPGSVLERAGEGVRVACADGSVTVAGLVDLERPGLASREVEKSLDVGDVLG
jgi:methionyl-tRNA formyltransferase